MGNISLNEMKEGGVEDVINVMKEGGIEEEDKKEVALTPEQDFRLKEIIAYESTNLQWSKLILNWGIIAVLVVIQLMRGSGKPSIIDAIRCDTTDWILFMVL